MAQKEKAQKSDEIGISIESADKNEVLLANQEELEKEKNEIISKMNDIQKDYSAGNLLDEEYEDYKNPLDKKLIEINKKLNRISGKNFDEITPIELINSSEKYKNFIKPTISKIVLLLLLSPILLISFFISSCSLGFLDCNPGQSSENMMIIPFFILFINIVILYLISCLIVSGWNWISSRFCEKNKHYEKIALLAAIIFILIVWLILSKIFGYW